MPLWIVNDEQELLYRTWPVLAPEDASEWQVVAEGVVNRDLNDPPSRSTPRGGRSPSSST